MGVGTPEDLVEGVARGIDMFDCVLPTRNARNGQLFTARGHALHPQRALPRATRARPTPPARCYTCRTASRAYLRHLHLAGEMTAATLMTIHNLSFYLDTLRKHAGRVSVWVDSRSSGQRRSGRSRRRPRSGRLTARDPTGQRSTEVHGDHDARSRTLLALAGPPRAASRTRFASLILMALIFAIFYFVLILPMRSKQKKLEELVKGLKSGRQGDHQPRHLRHHRGRRGRRLPRPHRREDQDQGPEERGRRASRARPRKRRRSRMPPALQNPFVALARAHRRPGRGSSTSPCARSCGCGPIALRLVPARLPGGHLAALRARRAAGQDQPRPRPARAASTSCCRW